MVREFATPCLLVDNSRFQALGQSLDRAPEEVVLRPETLYTGDNLRVMAVAMGDDPGGVARGAVVGPHGRFWGVAVVLDVIEDKVPLFGREVRA